ncbi:DNA polymerase III subunit delta [Bacillus cytotoxicus]|uniref:DNA polymerase III subunit delta n=1 Tax=Bacillus cereus group sp. BfR-BA-01492 TaxID=2920361 RepID=UPI001F56EEB5|nr:DNA polymerase III subunit delta [Bacillus cereus group sp. BfR-BA-01492]EMA6341555.1 DNA polymerase III subunit delta [Bacillus cytotoxicus]
MISSVFVSACAFQQTVKEDKQFVETTGGVADRVFGPMLVKDIPNYFPVSFKVPTFLPYDIMDDAKGEVRKIGKEKAVLTIKYKQQEQGRKDYIELTVANFSYSFPYIVEQNRFQEQIRLNNGVTAYFKNKDEGESGEEFATLIWKEKELEYQLLYRNAFVQQESEVIKRNLLYAANNMKKLAEHFS